mmetsp:Transcript_41216/g.30299  ORF Transcript_41216/g.30299 Transcript_41216/m.30299 type:complete len:192 (-) Transcript_41216:29-604(-)
MGGRKQEDAKAKQERKKQVVVYCTSLFLNNNELRSIKGLSEVLQSVMWYPERLEWLDLSYCLLDKVEMELVNFPMLKTLYLHGNYIQNMDEIQLLKEFPYLKTLTLFGNSIAQIPGYRLFVLGVMYTKYESLRKLDSVLVTRKEFDDVIVWKERIRPAESKNLKKVKKPENPKKLPPLKEEENQAQAQNQN